MRDLAEIERRMDERWQALQDSERAGGSASEFEQMCDAYLKTLDEWARCNRALDAEAARAQARARAQPLSAWSFAGRRRGRPALVWAAPGAGAARPPQLVADRRFALARSITGCKAF